MAYTVRVRFLLPIRPVLLFTTCPYSSLSRSRIPSLLHSGRPYGKFQPLKTLMNGFQSALSNRVSSSRWKLYTERFCTHDIWRPACRLSISSIFGVSVVLGSVSLWSHIAHAMDGLDILMDDQRTVLSHSSDSEEDQPILLTFARKLLAPIFLLLIVLTNWDRPIILAAKVALILLSTKPSSFSVFLFIEQLCRHSMCQQPFLYKFKSAYAKKVEVEDYTIFCIAKVEFEDKKFTLIGILGSWWVLPLPTWEKTSFLFAARSPKNQIFGF